MIESFSNTLLTSLILDDFVSAEYPHLRLPSDKPLPDRFYIAWLKSKGFKLEGSGAMEIGNAHKLRKGENEEYITGLKTGKIRFNNVGSSVVKNKKLKAYVRFARLLVWLIFCSGLKALHEKLCSIIMSAALAMWARIFI